MLTALILLGQAEGPAVKAVDDLVRKASDYSLNKPEATKWVMKKKGKWVAMKTPESHLDKNGAWDSNVDLVASVVGRKGQFILVGITAGSPSGDVFDLSTYTFYPSGSIAKAVFQASRIDYGGQEVMRWYDRAGKQIRREENAVNGDGEATKDATFVERAKEFKLGSRVAPKTYASLPFSRLVKIQ